MVVKKERRGEKEGRKRGSQEVKRDEGRGRVGERESREVKVYVASEERERERGEGRQQKKRAIDVEDEEGGVRGKKSE